MTAPPIRRITQRDLNLRVKSAWEAKKIVQGQRAFEAGDRRKAAQYFEMAYQRNPKCYPALFCLASIAHVSCEHDLAIALLEKLLVALPGFDMAWYNLGTILQCVGRYEEAADHLRAALELDPSATHAHVNLGNALLGLGRHEEAHAEYALALAHTPNSAEATYNLAHYFLLTGQWERGWKCYEARWHIPGFTELNAITFDDSRTDVPRPWQGEPLSGCTLIVSGEQGWGDDVLCLRYAPQLRALGATVTWALRPGLIRLAELAVAPDRVVSLDGEVPGADYIVTTMTLHERLKITPETVPFADGYLRTAA